MLILTALFSSVTDLIFLETKMFISINNNVHRSVKLNHVACRYTTVYYYDIHVPNGDFRDMA